MTAPTPRSRWTLGLLATLVAASLLLSGCVPGFGPQADPAVDRSFYWGPIPEPMPLTASLTGGVMSELEDISKDMPQPPSDPTDQAAMEEYARQLEEWSKRFEESGVNFDEESLGELQDEVTVDVVAYQEQLDSILGAARSGGAQAVSAWQTLLVEAGMAVEGGDGNLVEVKGSTGAGIAVSDAELRLLSVVPGGAELPFDEFTTVVAETYEVDALELGDVMFQELLIPADVEFSSVFYALGPDAFHDPRREVRALEDVSLTIPQVQLALRRLAAEMSVKFDGVATGPASVGSVDIPRAFGMNLPIVAAGKPCEIGDPWGEHAIKAGQTGFDKFVFGKTLGMLAENSPDLLKQLGSFENGMGAASGALAIANALFKAFALQAHMQLQDGPLPRTKTRDPGEFRDLNVTMSFDDELWGDMRRCMSLFLGAVGLDTGPGDGSAEGLTLDIRSDDPWRLRIGSASGTGTDPTKRITNSNGEATFTLHGAPYSEKIPDTADPDDFDVSVRIESNIQNNDLFRDVLGMVSSLGASGPAALLQGVVETVSRMRFITFRSPVPFRDWVVSAYFDVTIRGSVEGQRTSHSTGTVRQECGGGTVSSSHTLNAAGSFYTETKRVRATLVTIDYSRQVVVFMEPDTVWQEGSWNMTDNGVREFTVPAHFTVDQQHSPVGLPPLPPPTDLGLMGCGDGNPNAEPPRNDCGVKNFTTDLTVNLWKDRTFWPVGDYLNENPWTACGGRMSPSTGLVPIGPGSCNGVAERINNYRPQINDVFDRNLPVLEEVGTYTCSHFKTGSAMDYTFDWTMTLERVEDPEG